MTRPFLPFLFAAATLVAQDAQEYRAKVAVLEKVTYYVEWPNASAHVDRPFVLGVLGRTPFGDELDAYFLTRKLKNRTVEIRYYRNPDDIAECDLLFICASERDRLPAVLARAKGKPFLTIGDTEGFAQAGVILNIVREGTRLRFEVNLTSAKASGILLMPGLLNLSKLFN
jgi:hypothetical protein